MMISRMDLWFNKVDGKPGINQGILQLNCKIT